MEAIGIVKEVYDTQKVSDRFQKREFILTLEANTPYPQHVSFQLGQEKCSLLESDSIGQEVKVQFNLRGREWNGPQGIKYFNTLEVWKVEKSGTASSTPAAGTGAAQTSTSSANNSAPATSTAAAPVFTGGADESDDLPF